MSAGLAAFARGLQSIDPIGREFIADLQAGAQRRQRQRAMEEVESAGAAAEAAARSRQTEAKTRAEYIDQVGRYEALKAQYPDLEAMAQKDPIQYRSLLAVNKIDPDAGATFDQFKAKRAGGGTELPQGMQGKYLEVAGRGPGDVDEAMLLGSVARANAAMRLGLDPKGYLDLAGVARNVVADRGQMARSAWEGLTGAYKDVSGREFQAGEGEKERGFKSSENAKDRAGKLAEISARGKIDKEIAGVKAEQQEMKDLKSLTAQNQAIMADANKRWDTVVKSYMGFKKDDQKLEYLQKARIPIKDAKTGKPIDYKDAKGVFGADFEPDYDAWVAREYPNTLKEDRATGLSMMRGLAEGSKLANPNRALPSFSKNDSSGAKVWY